MEHFDVLIVGAGLSGVGAAVHLRQRCPGKSFVILEGRASMGGTWDLFRYPGIRSDSDMHTLGYSFKPWKQAKSIADGPSILDYVHETAAEYKIDEHIRYNHKAISAAWSTADAAWTVEARRAHTGETVKISCNLLYMCQGYYSYDGGFLPEFEGVSDFGGTVIHPQKWPTELDYRGKNVIVIGSGATAMTLVPAMASDAAKVTMVQRSPTYVVSRPAQDAIANRLRKWLPEGLAYAITRWKNTTLGTYFYRQTRAKPQKTKEMILKGVRAALGPDYDVDKHFTPSYNPWDQRLCLVPDADLFAAINSGKAEVVTDHIDRFTKTGLKLKSGQELPADIIVTATGLNMLALGGMTYSVDGEAVQFPKTWTYKGMMYSDVPNLVSTFGYINASWTLRADLTAEYVCRLLNHMDEKGATRVTPRLRDGDRNMTPRLWIEGFSSGYMQRGLEQMPRQGDHAPWLNPQDFARDKKMIRKGALEDGALVFDNPVAAKAARVLEAAE
ncbi:cation diffusion facilitator CzcD-associated flavoprotein CzcO [Caulobacter ginsengisoli]|uniref:Cation diffusion facilitator CzcD-associated flavoprotein CzcO n=1 Tax=Caulobacter ginsengisoli TaxID=400775 RepID=A0ABU0IU26_9CAUL|nr:NAD(P)/FAD-dependent oxidoreductase [Caulobacter ginsengisoli]MDQ0464534.1 cation diffusion facilitator CzcD-associated flavoprotein CzcO [Caulobacter ginsengisoli]